MITTSNYPKFNEVMGLYEQLDEKILDSSQDLESIAALFVGGILRAEEKTVMFVAVEIYSRDPIKDSHSENSFATFPESLTSTERLYKSIEIAVVEVVEGGATVSKLVIGHQSWNILVTSTFLLSPRCGQVSTAGPGTNQMLNSTNMKHAQILFRKKNIKEFANYVPDVSNMSMSHYRQINSELDHKSSYYAYRRTLFQGAILQPATLFTLYQYPVKNYGISSKHKARKVSLFFHLVAMCINSQNSTVNSDLLKQLKDINIKHDTLDLIIKDLEKQLDEAGENSIDILNFLSHQKGLSKLTQSLSSNISVINNKVEQNITKFLSKAFGKI